MNNPNMAPNKVKTKKRVGKAMGGKAPATAKPAQQMPAAPLRQNMGGKMPSMLGSAKAPAMPKPKKTKPTNMGAGSKRGGQMYAKGGKVTYKSVHACEKGRG